MIILLAVFIIICAVTAVASIVVAIKTPAHSKKKLAAVLALAASLVCLAVYHWPVDSIISGDAVLKVSGASSSQGLIDYSFGSSGQQAEIEIIELINQHKYIRCAFTTIFRAYISRPSESMLQLRIMDTSGLSTVFIYSDPYFPFAPVLLDPNGQAYYIVDSNVFTRSLADILKTHELR